MLLKQITLVGAPQVLSALIPWAKAQMEGVSGAEAKTGKEGEEKRAELDVGQWYVPLTLLSLTHPLSKALASHQSLGRIGLNSNLTLGLD